MTVKIAMLKSGEDVIADVKEVVFKDPETQQERPLLYVFEKPYIVKLTEPEILLEEEAKSVSILFYPWAPMSKDKEFYVDKDWVVTLYEPQEDIAKSYTERKDGGRNDRHDGTTDGGSISESSEVYLTEESLLDDNGDSGTES